MTQAEKLSMVKSLLGVTDAASDAVLGSYIEASGKELIQWRYSYCKELLPSVVPEEYEMTQVFAVIAGFSMMGAEGETSHSEGDIRRSYKYSDTLGYIRSNVIPLAGCV